MSATTSQYTVIMTSNRYNKDMAPEQRILDQFPELDIDLRGIPVSDEDDLIARCVDADALLCSTLEAINHRVLSSLPKLKVVSRYGVGLDNVDLDAATDLGIIVTHYPQYCTSEVADHAVSLILGLNRRIVEFDRDLRQGAWVAKRFETRKMLSHVIPPLREQTLGIIGFGRIGRESAKRMAPFGVKIVVCDPYIDPTEITSRGAEPVALDELLSRSDIITIHSPLTPETRGLLGKKQFAAMKPGAILVNTARGPILDLEALTDALSSGHLGGAGLDVFYPEPLPIESPFYSMPNVILTPHAAYYSERSVETVRNETLNQALLALSGRRPTTVANPGVLEKVALV